MSAFHLHDFVGIHSKQQFTTSLSLHRFNTNITATFIECSFRGGISSTFGSYKCISAPSIKTRPAVNFWELLTVLSIDLAHNKVYRVCCLMVIGLVPISFVWEVGGPSVVIVLLGRAGCCSQPVRHRSHVSVSLEYLIFQLFSNSLGFFIVLPVYCLRLAYVYLLFRHFDSLLAQCKASSDNKAVADVFNFILRKMMTLQQLTCLGLTSSRTGGRSPSA